MIKDIIPEQEYYYDKDNNPCICSTLDHDFCFIFPFADPKDHTYRYLYNVDRGEQLPSDSNQDIYYSYDAKNYYYYIYFKKSYLQSKDKESADRNISLNLKILYGFILGETNKPESETDEKHIKCSVNSKPLIFDGSPAFGRTTQDSQDGSFDNFYLCFNLLNDAENPALYDDLKKENTDYILTINNVDYKFHFSQNKPVFESDKFITQNSSSYAQLIQDLDFPNDSFVPKTNPVLFSAGTIDPSSFILKAEDTHGLKKSYTISTKPSGQEKVSKPIISIQEDKVTITPRLKTTSLRNLDKVTVHYQINNENPVTITKQSPGDKIEFYLSGGDSTITAYQTCDNSTIYPSDTAQNSAQLEQVIYVNKTPDSSEYKGAVAEHPVTLKTALLSLKDKKTPWTIKFTSDYNASDSDIFEDNSFIYLKNQNSNFSLTMESSNNDQKIINAKSKGRVIKAVGFPLTLKKLIIINGSTTSTSPNGAGVYTERTLEIEDCIFYGNVTYEYGNGGGIYFNSPNAENLTIKNTKIGSTVNPNKAPGGYGGGIYAVTDGSVSLNNTLIGLDPGDNENIALDNFANYAYNGGGIYTASNSTSIDKACSLNIVDSDISKNHAQNFGGGFYSYRNTVINFLVSEKSNSFITHNHAIQNGGGGYLYNTQLTCDSDSTITGNSADNEGGGLYINGSEGFLPNSIVSAKINSNKALYGGGFSASFSCTLGNNNYDNGNILNGIEIYENSAEESGGGVFLNTDNFIIQNCKIKDNESALGCGIYSAKSFTFGSSILRDNKYIEDGYGNGIFVDDGTITFSKLFLILDDQVVHLPYKEKVLVFENNSKQDADCIIPIHFFNWSDKTLLADPNTDVSHHRFFEISHNDYVLAPDWKIYKREIHDPSYAGNTFQSVLDNLKNSATEENPGVIVFKNDFTCEDKEFKRNDQNIDVYSPAIFEATTSSKKRKYIIYGNGNVYDANRKNKPGHALYVGEYNSLDIYDISICGGKANSANLSILSGGGIYLCKNSSVTLKKDAVVGKLSFDKVTEDTCSNFALRSGAGVSLSENSTFTMEEGSCVCNNYSRPSQSLSNYSWGGGIAVLHTSSTSSRAKIILKKGSAVVNNYAETTGGGIYCGKNNILSLGAVYIYDNYSDEGTGGIDLAENSVLIIDSSVSYTDPIQLYRNNTNSTSYGASAIKCDLEMYATSEKCFSYFEFLDNTNNGKTVDFFLPIKIKPYSNSSFTAIDLLKSSFSSSPFVNTSNQPVSSFNAGWLTNTSSPKTYRKYSFEKDTTYNANINGVNW